MLAPDWMVSSSRSSSGLPHVSKDRPSCCCTWLRSNVMSCSKPPRWSTHAPSMSGCGLSRSAHDGIANSASWSPRRSIAGRNGWVW